MRKSQGGLGGTYDKTADLIYKEIKKNPDISGTAIQNKFGIRRQTAFDLKREFLDAIDFIKKNKESKGMKRETKIKLEKEAISMAKRGTKVEVKRRKAAGEIRKNAVIIRVKDLRKAVYKNAGDVQGVTAEFKSE